MSFRGNARIGISGKALTYSLGAAGVIIVIAWWAQNHLKQGAREALKQEQQRALIEQKYRLQAGLEDFGADAVALAYLAAGRMEAASPNAAEFLPGLAENFRAYAKIRNLFEQVRMISLDGHELIRIKRVVPSSGAPYYRKTTPAATGPAIQEAWLRELAAAEPGTPVLFSVSEASDEANASTLLRVGVSIPSQSAMAAGYVVLECRFDSLFAGLVHEDSRSRIRTLVLGTDGSWLRRGTPAAAAPAQPIPPRALPEFLRRMGRAPDGVLSHEEGLLSFDTLRSDSKKAVDDTLAKLPSWKVAAWTPRGEITRRENAATRPVWLGALLAVGLFVPVTGLAVTARERERAAVGRTEKAHALLQNVTDNAPDGIVAAKSVRGADRKIAAFEIELSNAHAERILGLSGPADILPASLFAPCVETVTGGASAVVEQEFRDTLGIPRWVRIKIVKRNDGVVLTLSDVTEQRKNLHELGRAKEAAEAASRTQNQFLAMMGHEIRTPMNGLLGFATLLSGTELNTEQRDYLATMRASGEALLRILEDILDYSHMEFDAVNLKSAPIDPRELVAQVHQLFFLAVDARKLVLLCDVDEDVPEKILGDDVRLRQILVNLMGNAVKFTEQGSVFLRVRRETREDGDHVVFHVKDDGPGIDPEIVDRLFRPFTQVDAGISRKFGGTGLGLSICKRLIELMGGEIGVHTAPGQGADFFFSLPVRQPGLSLTIAPSLPDPSWDGVRILVAEADPVNRKLIARTAEKSGARVRLAESGDEAMAIARKEHFDLVLLDMQMPGADGCEIARRMRKLEEALPDREPRMAICALAGNAAPEERQRCLEAGMDEFLAKPLRWEHLQNLLERIRGLSGGKGV